jgi:CheY-like chemotaxis protein
MIATSTRSAFHIDSTLAFFSTSESYLQCYAIGSHETARAVFEVVLALLRSCTCSSTKSYSRVFEVYGNDGYGTVEVARRMLLAAIMIGQGTRPTVLVVDDESGPREAFRLVLESEFNVLTADSGWAALDALRQNPIDVITLDLMMPAISGIETLKRIRKIDTDVEVVIVTALPAPDAASECRRLRASEVLPKPFSKAAILAAAERAAARRRDRRRAGGSAGLE